MTRPELESLFTDKVLPMVRARAWKYAEKTGLPYDDLVQAGSMAAWNALQRFEPERGFAVTSFLSSRIDGSLLDYAREQGSSLGWRTRNRTQLPKAQSLEHLSEESEHSSDRKIPFQLADYRSYDDICEPEEFEKLMTGLNRQEKTALRLYFRESLSMEQVGEQMEICESRVSQLVKRALEILRRRQRVTDRQRLHLGRAVA